MSTSIKERMRVIDSLRQKGIDFEHAHALRRISMTLHRWHELECGDGNNYASWSIERDEVTDKPYMVRYPHSGKSYRTPVADREKGALKRLHKIMCAYPHLVPYVQTDPRGASLYVIDKADLPEGADVSSLYNRGVAVY